MTHKLFPAPEDPRYVQEGFLDLVPENVSHLTEAPGTQVETCKIGFKWHAWSQHAMIENFQPPSYYENYLMTATYSDKMQTHQQSQLKQLTALHEGPGSIRSFVEIGCGDGSFLKYAAQQIPRVVGIDPSAPFGAEAVSKGFEILRGYVGTSKRLTDEKFDSFASRQVFEHLPDPADVLMGVRQMLNPGAVGLIEVPNGYRALRLKRFFEFFPDHVNYFSVNSLVALATDAGFNVVMCREAFGRDYLELWLRYDPDPQSWFEDIEERRTAVCNSLASKVFALSAQKRHVAIWGCGAKTLTILAASSPELCMRVSCVIDSDPHKHGLFVPNTNIPVVSPGRAAEMKPGAIFILALSYREEIASAIRDSVPSCTEIFTLDDVGIIVKL